MVEHTKRLQYWMEKLNETVEGLQSIVVCRRIRYLIAEINSLINNYKNIPPLKIQQSKELINTLFIRIKEMPAFQIYYPTISYELEMLELAYINYDWTPTDNGTVKKAEDIKQDAFTSARVPAPLAKSQDGGEPSHHTKETDDEYDDDGPLEE